MHCVFHAPGPAFQRPLAQSWHAPGTSPPQLVRFVPLAHVSHAVQSLCPASCWKEPASHAVQPALPCAPAYVPGSHFVHVESHEPGASLNVPTAHLLHEPPLASAQRVRKWPLPQVAQPLHELWPFASWKRPLAQFEQAVSQFAEADLNFPAPHWLHVPAAELPQLDRVLPALQGVQSLHELLPSSFWYSPVAHALHADALIPSAKRPVAQSLQVSV